MRKIDISKYIKRNGTAGLVLRGRNIQGPATLILDGNCIITNNIVKHITPKTGITYGPVPTDHFVPVYGLRECVIDHCNIIDVQFVIPMRKDKRKKVTNV